MKKSYKVALLVLALLLLFALSACNLFNHTHVFDENWSANDSTHYKVATCHKGLKAEEAPHVFDGGVRIDGVLQYTCSVCQHVTTNPMGDHKHELIFVQGTPATLSAAGSLSHYACAVCSAIYTDENGQNAIALDEVQLPQLQVTGLQVVSQPNVTSYEIGQSFDVTGMVVQATLSDGSTQMVTDYDVAPATFSQIVDSVTISWQGASAVVQVSVEEIYSVGATKLLAVGTNVKVKGYFVGVADEGPSADKEVLIKDTQTDDIVSVRNIPYGSWPNVGYAYGDLIRFDATIQADSGSHTPNKFYLDFSSTNGTIESTIVSSGNNVSYNLQKVVTVSSWEQMKQMFAVGSIKEGTYVKFDTAIYLGRYTGGSDGIEVYYLHLNSQASAIADVRTDGKRAVSIRNNVMEANIGANWKSLFFDEEPTSLATRCNVSVTALYTGANGAYFQLTILDDSWIQPIQQSAFTNQDAVVEVAYAYHRQGTQIQYDQKQDRRNINPSPEEATAQDGLVLDCSSYVNAVYYEAFGVNVLPYTTESKPPKTANYASYAKSNPSNADVVGYWETKDYTTKTAQSNLLNNLRAQLQPGDVLNYRRGETSSTSSGHAMIYVGNDVWLHCTGSDYQYNSDNPSQSVDGASGMEKAVGAILTESSDSMFKPGSTSSKYLFYEGGTSTIQNFCILRPIARVLTPTAKTTARMSARGLDIEKSVSVGEFNAIYLGQQVTYKIAISNTTSSSVTNVSVNDVLPAGATLVSASKFTNIGTLLTWSGIVPANTSVELSYTVQFASKTASVVNSSLAMVNGMPINAVVNTISGYTEAQMQSVANVAKGYASQGKVYSNAVAMVVDAYKTALGRDLGYTKVSTPLNEVLDTTNNTFKTDTDAAQMLVPTLYGGLTIKAGYKTDNARARIVVATSLAVGDVILASYNGGNSAVAYMYVGDNTLVEINSTEDVCKTVTISTNRYSNVLVSLVAYQKYVVLRPSMTA